MSWGGWSELKSFGDYCKINSYVDESKKGNGKWRITLEKGLVYCLCQVV